MSTANSVTGTDSGTPVFEFDIGSRRDKASLMLFSVNPVSYTHLDVYKRQEERQKVLLLETLEQQKTMFLESEERQNDERKEEAEDT